jgi:hypothetical protein
LTTTGPVVTGCGSSEWFLILEKQLLHTAVLGKQIMAVNNIIVTFQVR